MSQLAQEKQVNLGTSTRQCIESICTTNFFQCVSFRTAFPRSGGLSPGEGWDAVTLCG